MRMTRDGACLRKKSCKYSSCLRRQSKLLFAIGSKHRTSMDTTVLESRSSCLHIIKVSNRHLAFYSRKSFTSFGQECQARQRWGEREREGVRDREERRRGKIKDTGPGRQGPRPDVRRASGQAKRFKSKGSSPRTSTVDFNRYGGVRVWVSLTILKQFQPNWQSGLQPHPHASSWM